jgi:hypothetical protein
MRNNKNKNKNKMKNKMENTVVNTPIPSDVEKFLKENNFELYNNIGVNGRDYYDLYVSEEHQIIVVPNDMYDESELRYQVYTFKQYDEDDMGTEWKPSEEFPTFLPYLMMKMVL